MKLHLQSCEKEVLELVKQNKIFQSHFLDESEKKLFLHKREKSGYEIMFSTNKCEIFYKTLPELNRALLYVASTDVEENIKEECSFRELGVLIDVSRNAVVKVETLKKFIRILSLLGYNFCGLYIEDTIKIKNEPYFGYLRGAFTEKEIKEIDEYAQKYEIELRPYIQTLAHLNQIVRYEEYQKIIDTDDILLVGDKRTEILLENLIGTIAQCFSSRKLNIGMDEAHMLGLGKYLNRNGYQNRQEIMRKHLEKVLEICRKYGFQVQMWSDMFFRLAFQGEYYSHDIKELENVEIPPDVEIGYWDYYSIEKEHYESMIRNHKMLTENVAFIGSAWKWTGFIPHNRYSILNGKAALPVCREQKIASVTLTCWGDDGAEASVFSILPTLYEDANLAYTSKMEALIIIVLFTIIPIIGSLILMFYDYSVLGETRFIGLENFIRAFQDREFIIAVKNSVIFVVIVPVIQLLSILLALLVNQRLPGINIFRTLFYIPVVTSMVAVSIMWGFIFDPHGIINSALMEWGWISQPLGFLNSKYTAMPCLMFITVWQGLGYYMMMYLAGLQGIPSELTEAARIDGANTLQTIFKVKIPLLKPYIWLCTLNSVIAALGVFDVVFVLTQGGPNNATMVINYYSYTKAFGDFQFGYAAAIGAIQAVLTSMLSIVVFVYGKKGGMSNNE